MVPETLRTSDRHAASGFATQCLEHAQVPGANGEHRRRAEALFVGQSPVFAHPGLEVELATRVDVLGSKGVVVPALPPARVVETSAVVALSEFSARQREC